ncbi:MAG: 4Fe-4S protein, partial [Euryarchaeota archaeon]|nr:4Fe-4S protein [Euryarchaeota archaeon]
MLQIEKLLPGYNCGECGLSSCREFAARLVDV